MMYTTGRSGNQKGQDFGLAPFSGFGERQLISVYALHMSGAASIEPRVVPTERIVGISELATHFGLSKSAVSNWAGRHPDFPKPIKRLAASPLYDLAEVDEWYRQTAGSFPKVPEAVFIPAA